MKKSEELSMDTGAYLNSVFGLKGKVILITGAAGGIGNAISRGLAAARRYGGSVRPESGKVQSADG